ncbi:hypothetical protein ACTJKW_13860, partial [Serratia marcescens]
MADTAQLVVGLQLNDTNFKNKLTAAYRTAGEQSAKFNRQAQQDAKKTDESYQRIGGTLGGLAGKLAGLAGVELSLQGLAATSRQYGCSTLWCRNPIKKPAALFTSFGNART